VPVKHRNYRSVVPPIERVLRLFPRAGTASEEQTTKLLHETMAGYAREPAETTTRNGPVTELREALQALSRLSPLLKPAIIDACGHCIMHDGKVDVREYELMRLVADQLDCPMPPL